MKSAEALLPRRLPGHGFYYTHANSCEATYPRMVTLCKQKYDINDQTLYNLVTEAFPIVMFAKKLEDKTRKIMEITECEILPDGSRKIRTLFRFNIMENQESEGCIRVIGYFEKVSDISEKLQKRLLDNGMPRKTLKHLVMEGDNN